MTVIHLGAALPRRSSHLPADSASSVVVRLLGVAPDGGCRVSPASFWSDATRLCGPVPRLRRRSRGRFMAAGRYPASRSLEPGLSSPGSAKRATSSDGLADFE